MYYKKGKNSVKLLRFGKPLADDGLRFTLTVHIRGIQEVPTQFYVPIYHCVTFLNVQLSWSLKIMYKSKNIHCYIGYDVFG